jgi:hypothetical protein
MTAPAAAGVNRVHCILINTVFAMPASHPLCFQRKPFPLNPPSGVNIFAPKFRCAIWRFSPPPPLNPSAQSLNPITASDPRAPLLIGLIALLA